MNDERERSPVPQMPSLMRIAGSLAAFVGGFFVGLVGACVVALLIQGWVNEAHSASRKSLALAVEIGLLFAVFIVWIRTLKSLLGSFLSGVLAGATIAFLVCAACFGLLGSR